MGNIKGSFQILDNGNEQDAGSLEVAKWLKVGGLLIANGDGLNLELVPLATTEETGKVKIGNGISVDSGGEIALVTAGTNQLGGVKVGEGLSIAENGTLYLTITPTPLTNYNQHLADPAPHGSTATPTADKIAKFNAEGNLQSGTPTEGAEVATKSYVDTVVDVRVKAVKIIVTAKPGALVTFTNGSISQTLEADENGIAVLEAATGGTWTINGTYMGVEAEEAKTVSTAPYGVFYATLTFDVVVYGVRRYINDPNTDMIRLGDSADFTFTPETDETIGQSDFDDGPIFKDIKTCLVKFVEGEMVVVYEDDENFTRTPEDGEGDVFVEFPKFYFKRDVTHKNDSTNAYEDLYISDRPLTGFSVDPGHMDRGDGEGVRDKIYIAAYPSESNKANSRSGNQGVGMNVSTFVPKAQEIDSSVFGFEICAQMMLLMLYQIMVADFDAEEIFGENKKLAKPNNGTTDSMEYHSGAAVDESIVYDLKNIKTFGSFESGEVIPQGTIVNRSNYYRATVDTVGGNWNNVSADFEMLQYNKATEYHIGDITVYSGVPFRCVQDCSGKTPSITSTYWSKYFEGYNANRSYKKYEREVKDGILYECKEATTGEFDKTKWEVIEKTVNIKFLGIENAWGGYGNHVMGVWGADYKASLYFAINPRSYPSNSSELANLTKTNSNNGYYASFIKDLGHNADYPWFFYPSGKINQKNGLCAAVGMAIGNYTVFYGAYYVNNHINGPFTIDGTSSFNGGNGLARLEILPNNQEN